MASRKAARPATAATVSEPPGNDLGQIDFVAIRNSSARQLLALVALAPNNDPFSITEGRRAGAQPVRAAPAAQRRGLSDSPPAGKSRVGGLAGPLRREGNDDYRPAVAVLNAHWRVIACRTGIQWILQKRCGGPNSWRGRYFCRTRAGLIECVREHAGQIDGVALERLLRLPQRIGGAS